MSDLAPLLQAYFTDRLMRQRQASPHTVAAYRDTFKLLLGFVAARTGRHPAQLGIADLDAPTVGAFLDHLSTTRHNSAATRNARLAAVHSLFRYAAFRAPEHAASIQRVLAIPPQRRDRAIVTFLTPQEIEALLAAPDRTTRLGRRDQALLALATQTGLRVSELTALRVHDAQLTSPTHVHCHGKGRKDRITPLTSPTTTVLRAWLGEHGGQPTAPLFPARHGGPLSRDTVARIVAKHAATAAAACPSLRGKNVTPHVLRHSAAMTLLHAGVDITVIALWLGHESTETTQTYLHADLTLKERALARTTPPEATPGRYQAPDTLLAFLDSL